MAQVIAIGLLGLMGIFSRYAIDTLAGKWFEAFPVGALLINLLGSMVAGVVHVVSTEKALISPQLSVGLLVGFCGGFTTFSAYSLQAFLFLEKGDLIRGFGYLCVSPFLGLIGVYLGLATARAWA